MSWAHGTTQKPDGTRIDVGYSVKAECDEPGCGAVIDRGVSYRCGYVDWDHNCGNFYCGDHLTLVSDRVILGSACLDVAARATS